MDVRTEFPLVDQILAAHADALGAELGGYRNHVFRTLNYYLALRQQDGGRDEEPVADSVLVAAAFHDLGIWTERSFDYLAPSARLASEYLAQVGRDRLGPEVDAVIVEHHKVRRYRGPQSRDVELFRRADLIDVSTGVVRFGLPAEVVRAVKAAYPGEGFHRRLVSLAARHFLRAPLRPLPMMRW